MVCLLVAGIADGSNQQSGLLVLSTSKATAQKPVGSSTNSNWKLPRR
jgi:hypothetical protein